MKVRHQNPKALQNASLGLRERPQQPAAQRVQLRAAIHPNCRAQEVERPRFPPLIVNLRNRTREERRR